ncbi:hypothetical protein ACFJIX_17520 [Roseateles sp. UC29_93]|uniref:hypothetical protein n=1 Tax=Roseateles sp. UC29_93 TaxID=3350177 RepID=UPI00366CDBED
MDEITKKWFDVSMVRVTRARELHGWYSDEELIRLSGAPKGSHLDVVPNSDGQIELRVTNQDLLCEPLVRRVSQAIDGGYVFEIENAAFVLRSKFRRQGIGTRSVAIELHEAKRLSHFTKVVVNAVGDSSSMTGPMAMVGYYAWASMGFNAPLPADLLQHPALPDCCRDCMDLIELMRTDAGQEFWLSFGRSIHLEFQLKESSRSWDHFHRYATKRNIEVTS